jgi:hypothetical protein
MIKNTPALYAIYRDRDTAARAVDSLRENGIASERISVMASDEGLVQELAEKKGTKAPEGAATGVGTGAVIGGAVGWMAALGAVVVPGFGAVIAAGPIVAALTGAGVGGAVGGAAGALIGAGFRDDQAKRYAERLRDGGVLLTIDVPDVVERQRAWSVLENSRAEELGPENEADVVASRGPARGTEDEAEESRDKWRRRGPDDRPARTAEDLDRKQQPQPEYIDPGPTSTSR